MRIVPLVEFYARRHEQIAKLFTGKQGIATALEISRAVIPILTRRFPRLNPDGILDDALETAEKVFEDPDSEDARRYPDGTQI